MRYRGKYRKCYPMGLLSPVRALMLLQSFKSRKRMEAEDSGSITDNSIISLSETNTLYLLWMNYWMSYMGLLGSLS